jgi:hypothetical protein
MVFRLGTSRCTVRAIQGENQQQTGNGDFSPFLLYFILIHYMEKNTMKKDGDFSSF